MESRTKRIFYFVFLTLFVDLLAFTLILPLLPKILDYYATNDKSNFYRFYDKNLKLIQGILGVPESHNQVLVAGMLGSWFSLLQFILSPFFGALSDKFGRKSILLLSISGSSVSYAIWLMASKDFRLFFLSRTIGGLSKTNVGLSLAIVSDVSNHQSRGKGMAAVGASFSLAFIIGPLMGAYLSTLAKGEGQLENRLIVHPALIALTLSLINAALVAIFLPETNTLKNENSSINRKQKSQEKRIDENTLLKAFYYIEPRSLLNFSLVENSNRNKEKINFLKTTGWIYFLYLLFYSGLEFTLSFLTHQRFGFSPIDQGKLYLFSGTIMALIQGGYIRRIKGGREAFYALLGLVSIIPSFIWLGLSSTVNHVYQALALYAFSSAIVVPCLTTIVSANSPVESRGVVMGTFRSIGSLARAIGPVLASAVFWTFGPTVCYIGGALALTIPLYKMRNLLIM
jgi:MFS family permease